MQDCVFKAPDPTAGHCWPTPLPETPGYSQAGLVQPIVGSRLLSPVSWCTQGLVCALEASVSPLLWKFYNQIPLAFKVRFPGGSQSLWQIPRLWNTLWALDLSQQCENFFGIIVLWFVVVCSLALQWDSCAMLSWSASARVPGPTQASADPYLHRRHSKTQRHVWLSLLWGPWVLVCTKFCLSPPSISGGCGIWF